MIIVRLTGANPLVRLWAVQQLLQSRFPANAQSKIQIVHSPNNDETLLLVDSIDIEEKNVSYLDTMPIAHTPRFTIDEFASLARIAAATAIDMEAAKKQITAALRTKSDLAVVISLEKQQLDFSSKFAAALREIADRNKDDPDFSSKIVEFCIADLVKKKVLPFGLQAVRQMQRINKFIIALTAAGQVEPWLKQQGISFKKQEQCNFSRSIVLPASKTKPASIIFDSVAGKSNEGAALYVHDMLGLAQVLLRSYELFHTAENLGKAKTRTPKTTKVVANSDNKPTIPTKPQRKRVANTYDH